MRAGDFASLGAKRRLHSHSHKRPDFTIEKRIRFKYNKNRNRQAAIKRGKRIDKTETHEEEGYFENPPESAYKYVLELA